MKDEETEHGTALTRRIVLTGGVGCALTLLIPEFVRASAESRGLDADANPPDDGDHSELYVFRGSHESRTVIAATWAARSDHASHLRMHAGEQTWTVALPAGQSSPSIMKEAGCQLFAGDILDRAVGHDARLRAVVIEAPTQMISSGGSTQVWAERISHQGCRFRIGSAFMTRLAAANSSVAKFYHASSPAEDGEVLTRLAAEAIAVNARTAGYTGNARSYGLRVAFAITPDSLRFDPRLPVGFTFAAQNGRHPDDAAHSVVDTVLNGTLAPQGSQPSPRLNGEFPYFPLPTRA